MFDTINRAYNATFTPNKLSLGLVVPLENYATSAVPSMRNQVERIQLAESLGFSAVWLRDVPFNVRAFGDAGQIYDPFVYLGVLAAQTRKISLGVSSIILPLRHPAHVAKAAASVDELSGGRLLLGIASGDRPEEYPAMNIPFEQRGQRFRDSFSYIEQSWASNHEVANNFGRISRDMELLPKPSGSKIPMLITGGSQQNDQWLAENGDGWMLYPRDIASQKSIIEAWRQRTREAGRDAKPVMQPLYIDLSNNPDSPLRPIHLGYSGGMNALREYLLKLEKVGINHVALNLRFNSLPIEESLEKLANELLPTFATN